MNRISEDVSHVRMYRNWYYVFDQSRCFIALVVYQMIAISPLLTALY